MSDKTVWFGTENKMKWIKAPMPGVGRNLNRNGASKQLLNGGAWRRYSATGARSVKLTWPTMTGDDVRAITSFLDGTYGLGPFYYCDPFAERANLLPQWLAVPWLATEDAPLLWGSTKPTRVDTPANSYEHPSFGAQYAIDGEDKSFLFAVPPGETVQLGWRGSVTGTASLQAVITNGGTPTAYTLAPMSVTNSALSNHDFVSSADGAWVELKAVGTGTLTAYSLHMSLGDANPTGAFVKGEGFTALQLDGDPSITGYSAVEGFERQAVTADFIEVGAWA